MKSCQVNFVYEIVSQGLQCVDKTDCVCEKMVRKLDVITQDLKKVGTMVEIQGVTQVL